MYYCVNIITLSNTYRNVVHPLQSTQQIGYCHWQRIVYSALIGNPSDRSKLREAD